MGRLRKNLRDSAPHPAAPALDAADAQQIAAEFGVGESVVHAAAAAVGWASIDSDTPAGIQTPLGPNFAKIREQITAQMQGAKAAAQTGRPAGAAAATQPHREDLRLTRVFRWSNNILAERANGLEVVLHVRNNRHLEAGMVLRQCIEGPMGWTYEGRLPRVIGERQLFYPPSGFQLNTP